MLESELNHVILISESIRLLNRIAQLLRYRYPGQRKDSAAQEKAPPQQIMTSVAGTEQSLKSDSFTSAPCNDWNDCQITRRVLLSSLSSALGRKEKSSHNIALLANSLREGYGDEVCRCHFLTAVAYLTSFASPGHRCGTLSTIRRVRRIPLSSMGSTLMRRL